MACYHSLRQKHLQHSIDIKYQDDKTESSLSATSDFQSPRSGFTTENNLQGMIERR